LCTLCNSKIKKLHFILFLSMLCDCISLAHLFRKIFFKSAPVAPAWASSLKLLSFFQFAIWVKAYGRVSFTVWPPLPSALNIYRSLFSTFPNETMKGAEKILSQQKEIKRRQSADFLQDGACSHHYMSFGEPLLEINQSQNHTEKTNNRYFQYK
jgi:hypothetical protein